MTGKMGLSLQAKQALQVLQRERSRHKGSKAAHTAWETMYARKMQAQKEKTERLELAMPVSERKTIAVQSVIDQEVNKLKGGTDGRTDREKIRNNPTAYAGGWADWRFTYGSNSA